MKQIYAILALLSAAPLAAAQAKPSAAIPAMPVTSAPQPATVPAPTGTGTHRAVVTWLNGMLTVEANNSSLNSILRDISLRTGMKIVGGVQEERVFGHYGPATAATVISQLMGGAKCNVLLQSDTANIPVQLTLTPLTGGVTPPNPMQAAPDAPEEPQPPVAAQPTAPQRDPDLPPPSGQPQGTPSQQPAGTGLTTQQSPNGVKTPEDYMKELLQQQQRNRNQTSQPQ